MSDVDEEIAALKAELRRRGWYVRYTEWPLGHEVVIHARADTSRHLVTDWQPTELAAWQEALRLAESAADEHPTLPPRASLVPEFPSP
jgi:hypothetical protein